MQPSIIRMLYHCVVNGIKIVMGKEKKRWLMVAAYGKIVVKYVVLVRLLRINLKKERFLGYTVHVAEYAAFLYLFEEIFVKREYDVQHARAAPIIIDGGANIGIATLFFKYWYPQSHILAFEPSAEAFALLQRNVEENKLRDVALFKNALAERERRMVLHVEKEHPGSLVASLVPQRVQGRVVQEDVQAVSLARYIKGRVDLLKLDIEGAEGRVLKDLAQRGKLQQVDAIIMEYHHNIPKQPHHFAEVLALLEKQGFRYKIKAYWNYPYVKESAQDIMVYGYRE